jgi:hypothetical protein
MRPLLNSGSVGGGGDFRVSGPVEKNGQLAGADSDNEGNADRIFL